MTQSPFSPLLTNKALYFISHYFHNFFSCSSLQNTFWSIYCISLHSQSLQMFPLLFFNYTEKSSPWYIFTEEFENNQSASANFILLYIRKSKRDKWKNGKLATFSLKNLNLHNLEWEVLNEEMHKYCWDSSINLTLKIHSRLLSAH